MSQSNSGNLSKGDVISFVALLLLGLVVFFGLNFTMLGNRLPSVMVAVLLFMLMVVFVFLAAYAKAQDFNQDKWKAVEYTMLGLYVAALVPCYLYAGKFFDVMWAREEITQTVERDLDDIDHMFAEYRKGCESRVGTYQTELEALLESEEGRKRMVRLLELDKRPADVSRADVSQAVSSFSDMLELSAGPLEEEKAGLAAQCEEKFKGWDLLFMPQYASELAGAKERYAQGLEEAYAARKSKLEAEAPALDVSSFVRESNIGRMFASLPGFSFSGLLAVVILGGLGLFKYVLGEKSKRKQLRKGEAGSITEDGGFIVGERNSRD